MSGLHTKSPFSLRYGPLSVYTLSLESGIAQHVIAKYLTGSNSFFIFHLYILNQQRMTIWSLSSGISLLQHFRCTGVWNWQMYIPMSVLPHSTYRKLPSPPELLHVCLQSLSPNLALETNAMFYVNMEDLHRKSLQMNSYSMYSFVPVFLHLA